MQLTAGPSPCPQASIVPTLDRLGEIVETTRPVFPAQENRVAAMQCRASLSIQYRDGDPPHPDLLRRFQGRTILPALSRDIGSRYLPRVAHGQNTTTILGISARQTVAELLTQHSRNCDRPTR